MTDSRTIVLVSTLGLVGVAAMAPTIPRMLSRVTGERAGRRLSVRALTVLAVAQSCVFVVLCAWIGTRLGPRLGLCVWPRGSWSQCSGGVTPTIWGPLLAWSILVGGAGGAVAARVGAFVRYLRETPLYARLLYGGLTEEVIVRWGCLAAVTAIAVFVSHRLLGVSGAGDATIAILRAIAVVLTNAGFAVAHISALRAADVPRPAQVAALIFVVSLPWGALAWHFGLVAAMIAHAAFHATIAALTRSAAVS